MRTLFGVLLLLGFFLSATSASAQFTRSVELVTNPLFPEPQSTVTVSANTFSFDIDRANVVWRVDGTTVREGRGIKSIDVFLGEAGEATTVSFEARRSGETLSQTLTLRPSAIDLIVEPRTYTPVFFSGKSLATHEAPLRIVALPFFGEAYDSNDLIFTWRVNGTVINSQSGVGKDVLTTSAAPISRRTDIRVDIESIDGSIQGRASTSIRSIDPLVLLYEVNPLFGLVLDRTLTGEEEFEEEEITVRAEPFYMPGRYREALPLTYSWKLNGQTVQSTNDDRGSITLRQAGTGRGRARIEVTAQNKSEAILRGVVEATLLFGREQSGLFNF